MTNKSVIYAILRLFAWALNRAYYREVRVLGRENLPKNKAVLLVSNHQNALMDPLALLCSNNLQPVFLSRSDIFQGKIKLAIFRFFRMLPVYRQKDGGNVAKRNESGFAEINNILTAKQCVAVFPEATQWAFRRLRPLKKGATRIAFIAEETNNWELDLQIVPAGIFYSNYVSPMAVLRVHYGKSFGIAHYKDLYQSNKDEAIRQLTKEMENRIRAEIIHIAQRNYYTTINRAADIYANTLHPNSSNKAFFARKEIAEKLDMLRPEQGSEAFEYLEKILTNFDNLLKELHFTEREYISPINTKQVFSNALGCLIALPFVLLGVFVNSFPIAITELLTRTMTKDPEFIASYRITFSAILFPVNTLIISILLAKFIGLYAFLLLGTIPFLAHFSLRYGLNLLYFARNVAFIRAKARKQTNELAVLHNCIIAHIQQLTRQEKP